MINFADPEKEKSVPLSSDVAVLQQLYHQNPTIVEQLAEVLARADSEYKKISDAIPSLPMPKEALDFWEKL